MNIFVYSDESGVLDKAHNDIFVFGGIVFLSKDERDIAARKYSAAERSSGMPVSMKRVLKLRPLWSAQMKRENCTDP